MQTIELLLGSIIVVLTLADVFQSVVVPRPTRRSHRLAPFLLNGIWPLWKWVALRFSSPKHCAAFLGIYAPLTVIILLLLKILAELPGFLTAWEEWSTEVMIGSLSYPVLPYFRSERPDESWVSALGALLDAAILIISCIEGGPAGPAHLLYQSGCELVNDLKDYFKISPAQTQAETPRTSFEVAYTRLKLAGFCLADPEPAWASCIVLRSAYSDSLHRLMNYWVVSQRKF
jgi:hypothetical protein